MNELYRAIWEWMGRQESPFGSPQIVYGCPAFVYIYYDDEGEMNGNFDLIFDRDYVLFELDNNLRTQRKLITPEDFAAAMATVPYQENEVPNV